MIYLIRHGQTEFNRDGRIQGQMDSLLTPLGCAQAARVGERLREIIGAPAHWTLVASPLGRTVHTATIIASVVGLSAPALDDRLLEVGMGEWQGLLTEDIDLASPGRSKGASRYTFYFDAPGGETLAAMTARLRSWLDDALADPKPRIVVSHGVAGRILRGLYLGQHRDDFLKLPAPQDAFFRLSGGRVERIDCDPVALASDGSGR